MTDGPGITSLQPRPVRAVRLVAALVESGADAGRLAGGADTRVLTVGSAADCDLVLTDPTVSRYHLEVRHGTDGLVLVDLGSRNGTFVGAVRVERAVVAPGTRVRLGGSTVVVDDGGAGLAPAPAAAAPLPGLIAHAPAMREVAALASRLAAATTSILIEGETGVGKEVVARAIHDGGPRRAAPFVVVDCGSMPATLIASQLFGHDRGAFTGADSRRLGAFERANGGTVFLDELGELPPALQANLLGALERRRFRRLGGRDEISIDVRVVSATNRDLRAEVNAGTFRLDLYYRLAVVTLALPPLRAHAEDLELLVEHFLRQAGHAGPRSELISEATLRTLAQHHWPGNVRELRNVIEATLAMGEAPPLELDRAAADAAGVDPFTAVLGLDYKAARLQILTQFEARYCAAVLARAGGNTSLAARQAQMNRSHLLELLQRHHLK